MAKQALLTRDEERQLIAAAQGGDDRARGILIERNMGLCGRWAAKYSIPTWMERDDLVIEGVIGLNTAISKFDPTKGTRFSTYAVIWIKQAIKRHLEKNYYAKHTPSYMFDLIGRAEAVRDRWLSTVGKEPTPEELADEVGCTEQQLEHIISARSPVVSIDSLRDDNRTCNFLDLIPDDSDFEETAERSVCLYDCLKELEPIDRRIIEHRYGLNGTPEKTLQEVGDQLSLCRERVRQKEKIIMAKLRAIASEKYKEDLNDLRNRL